MPRKNQPTVGTATTASVAGARIDEDAGLQPTPEPTPEPAAQAEPAPEPAPEPAAEPEADSQAPVAMDPTPPPAALEPAPPAPPTEEIDPHVLAVALKVARLANADRELYPTEQSGIVLFVSSAPEAETFPVRVGTEDDDEIRGRWDGAMEHVIWRVPAGMADRFSRHSFVKTGRILRAA